MKSCILFFALFLYLRSFASDFKFSDIPMKDGNPYYELTIPADNAGKNELFHRAQLFLAEYFKKTTPEIKIEDKEDGILVARITLSYNFTVNPEIYHGRSLCLLHFKIENGTCRVTIYNFELYRQTEPSRSGSTIQEQSATWKREKESEIYKKAANENNGAAAEIKAMNERVQKLEDALTAKMKE